MQLKITTCAIKDNKKYGYFGYYWNGSYALKDATNVGKTTGEILDSIANIGNLPVNFSNKPEFQRVYTQEEHINRIRCQITEFEWSNFFKPVRKRDNTHDYF